MRPLLMVGIFLIMGGTIALAYQSIHYSTQEEVINLGTVKVNANKDHTLSIPPFVGITAIICGGALLLVSFKRD